MAKDWLEDIEDFFAETETQNRGQFKAGSKRAREAGRKGGKASSGKFVEGSQRAKEAGRKGGKRSRSKK